MPKSLTPKVQPAKFVFDTHYLQLFDQFQCLNLRQSYLFSLFVNQLRLSVGYTTKGKHGKRFYSTDGKYFYVATKYDYLMENRFLPNSRATLAKDLTILQQSQLIKVHRREHHLEIEMPPLKDCINDYLKAKKQATLPDNSTKFKNRTSRSSKNEQKYNRHHNEQTLNYQKHMNTRKNKIFAWKTTTAHNLGISPKGLDSVVKFVEIYKLPLNILHKIYYKVIQARNYIRDNYIVNEKLIPLESNPNVSKWLPIALQQYFGQIEANTNAHKSPNKNKFMGWLISKLETNFEDWLEVKRPKSNKKTKKTDKKATRDPNLTIKRDAQGNVKYVKQIPKWAKNGYHEKLHPTSKKLQRKIQKQLNDLNNPKDTNESKQNKHGFGNPVDINTGKSKDTQDNKRDANESKPKSPKKSSSKPLNNKSKTDTQSNAKTSDSSTHVKNKDTAVGRKTELSKLKDEYNRIADDKFKKIHSKVVDNTATDAEIDFCAKKSNRITSITNKIQKIERKIEKDKANAIPNTANNSNDSSDEDLPF